MRQSPKNILETGILRSVVNSSNGIDSDETRIHRPDSAHNLNPLTNALDWYKYHDDKNKVLAQIHVDNALDNRLVHIKQNIIKPRRPELPFNGGIYANFANVPWVSFTNPQAGVPIYNRYGLHRDPVGHAITPQGPPSIRTPNLLYYGNPWSSGGVYFHNIRKTPEKFPEKSPTKPISARDQPSRKSRKRVTFAPGVL